MTSEKIINELQKVAKINLSTRERNWIKDNTIKRSLFINPTISLFIDLDEINSKLYTIIQNGKSRKIDKIDRSRYAIVVSFSGCCRILLPKQ